MKLLEKFTKFALQLNLGYQHMTIYETLKSKISKYGAAYLILIDPDKVNESLLPSFTAHCEKCGVDGFLVGGSLMINGSMKKTIKTIKENCNLPAIIFPGSVNQIESSADAILFLSLISGRNPELLIGSHVIAAPMIKQSGIEPISTGYMLIKSGSPTTAEYISNSKPIPRNKPEIATATALAGEYLGMKMIYLEAGSGADNSVPDEIINMVSSQCSIPIIVGGGICSSNIAAQKVKAGANIIITGNYFENPDNWDLISEFANSIHQNSTIEI